MSGDNSFLEITARIFIMMLIIWVWRIITKFNFTKKMKNHCYKLKSYFQKIYRITLGYKHFEKYVWNELIELHKKAKWHYGIFAEDKYIETVFEISENKNTRYFYSVDQGYFHCRVRIIEDFHAEITTDLFVLASHFNNLLNYGVVMVNVENKFIEYQMKSDFTIHVIFPDEIHAQLIRHHKISQDIFWAFDKLIEESEEPAIIIADLLKMREERNS